MRAPPPTSRAGVSAWASDEMFLTTALVYPLELALLCLGAGLLVDRLSGAFLPLALLPT